MRTFDATKPDQGTGPEWTPLATDQYGMHISRAWIAPAKFPNDRGEFPDDLTVEWKLDDWNEEFEEAGYMKEQTVFQHFNPWYGISGRGPSKFKLFVDQLQNEQLIPAQYEIAEDEAHGTQGHLVGIRRRVTVEKYIKSMGANMGQFGNRVLAMAPPKAARKQTPSPAPEAPIANGFPFKPTDIAALNLEELHEYAFGLAQECGGGFAKKAYDTFSEDELRAEIPRLERYLSRKTAAASPDELF